MIAELLIRTAGWIIEYSRERGSYRITKRIAAHRPNRGCKTGETDSTKQPNKMDIIVTRAGIAAIDPVFLVEGTQHGSGCVIHDTPFHTEAEAISEAESRWNKDHDNPEFSGPESKRFTWSVSKYSDWNPEQEEYANIETVWSREADEA